MTREVLDLQKELEGVSVDALSEVFCDIHYDGFFDAYNEAEDLRRVVLEANTSHHLELINKVTRIFTGYSVEDLMEMAEKKEITV